MTKEIENELEVVTLPGDPAMDFFKLQGFGGKELHFHAKLFSECSLFNDDNGEITRMSLYMLADKRLVYYMVSGNGKGKDARTYLIKVQDDFCDVDNGLMRMVLPSSLMFSVVFGMCGLGEGQEVEMKETLEQSLKAVNQ